MTEWMDKSRKEIYGLLDRSFPHSDKKVEDAARYAVVSKGHLWRPLLTLASGKAFGVSEEAMLPYSLTSEEVHTASLIMDDLPSMDNSDTRRKKPSCHKEYDVATTELAFYHLIESSKVIIQGGDLPDEVKLRLLDVSSRTAFELIQGQERDLYGVETSLTDLTSFYEQKTGALFAYSVLVGGIIGGASEEALARLESLGRNLGITYQIQDDILDVLGDAEVIGKPTSQDGDKNTVVKLLGVERSKELMKSYQQRIKSEISFLQGNERDVSFLKSIVEDMFKI